jgi:hypothetical protein
VKAIRIALGCLCYVLAIVCLVVMTMAAALLLSSVGNGLFQQWKLMLITLAAGIVGFAMLRLGDLAMKNLWQRR